MTLDEIDKLTVGEVRAICERAAAALAELQRLGIAPVQAVYAPPSLALAPPQPVDPRFQLSAAEQAAKQRLLTEMRARDDEDKAFEAVP